MELVIIIISVLSIFFSLLLPHCSASLQLTFMKPHLQSQVNAHHLSLPPFPRKLMSTEQQVKEHEEATTQGASTKNVKANFSGKEQKMKVAIGRKEKKKAGKREEWEEGEDATQYFTMDYSRVRRRRPIHNKSTPVAP